MIKDLLFSYSFLVVFPGFSPFLSSYSFKEAIISLLEPSLNPFPSVLKHLISYLFLDK